MLKLGEIIYHIFGAMQDFILAPMLNVLMSHSESLLMRINMIYIFILVYIKQDRTDRHALKPVMHGLIKNFLLRSTIPCFRCPQRLGYNAGSSALRLLSAAFRRPAR